jgi:hypothetical protein
MSGYFRPLVITSICADFLVEESGIELMTPAENEEGDDHRLLSIGVPPNSADCDKSTIEFARPGGLPDIMATPEERPRENGRG